MGAPKQKWTAEEEAALKAGVLKHGTGKWRTILSDPEFSAILHSRSNVDLKDKWRNINVTAIWGSRQKAKLALKRTSVTPKLDGRTPVTPKHDGWTQPTPKHDDNKMALSTVPRNDEVVDAKPLAISSGTLRASGSKEPVARLYPLQLYKIVIAFSLNSDIDLDGSGSKDPVARLYLKRLYKTVLAFLSNSDIDLDGSGSKEPVARLDKLILEAISNLKEANGSDRASIANYIVDQYWPPENLRKLLATKLKFLTANGTLIKAKHKYRIVSTAPVSVAKRSPKLLVEGRQKGSPKAQKKEINILTKSQVDGDLSRMRGMTAQEAAAAAAQAIAEAEVAIAEAEEAAREAERAEAEAEAAQVFAKAAMKALKCRALHT